jgi:GT2 family glycosyltransferase
MKTLLGIVTFGNLPFTQLAIREAFKTTTGQLDLAVVVGKPGDTATASWLREKWAEIDACSAGPNPARLHCIEHDVNRGFPASLNDIYDVAFVRGDYDAVIFMGNDVVPYPGAIDALIKTAEETDWEWIGASQFDVKSLCARYPEAQQYFSGPTYTFNDWQARPWEMHRDIHAPGLTPNVIADVRNLCLFKRSVFEKIGYADVNFWPGGYFEDNDYCRRGNLAEIRSCLLHHAAYFHFWSRTIHQGTGTSGVAFGRNSSFYQRKWGGAVDQERFALPFNGVPAKLDPQGKIPLGADLKQADRDQEASAIAWWSGL